MVVDDEKSIHDITRLSLQDFVFDSKTIFFYSAYNTTDAKKILEQNPDISLILLDVVMEEVNSGLKFVNYIRNELKNQIIQIIIRTGQPGEAPEKEVIIEYDINDYKEKTELTQETFYSSIITALRSFRDLNQLEMRKHELLQILNTIEEKNTQLEQIINERTHELTVKNKNLDQALCQLKETQYELILQEKMASVGMLSKGIAHEIQNPLNFINNFSEMASELVTELRMEVEDNKDKLNPDFVISIQYIIDDLSTNCSKIKQHGMHAGSIIKNMLLQSQKTSIHKEFTNIKNLMNNSITTALQNFERDYHKVDVKIEKNYAANLEPVFVSPDAIDRILIYLIDNALDALDERTQRTEPNYAPTLLISLQQQDNAMTIKIRDNGPGIPRTTLSKIFEPFYSTKPTGKGNTGLGLSICYDIVVNQHKGELNVNSEEQNFTEFTVTLPINPGK